MDNERRLTGAEALAGLAQAVLDDMGPKLGALRLAARVASESELPDVAECGRVLLQFTETLLTQMADARRAL